MKQNQRDWLSTLETIVKMVSMILVPLVIWALGTWYTHQQKEIEEVRIREENNSNRLTLLMKNLSSENPRERKMAIVISRYFATKEQLPAEVVQALALIAESDTNREVSEAAVKSLNVVAKSANDQAGLARDILQELPVRIYLQFGREFPPDAARRIRETLIGQGYQVPESETRSGFKVNEIRYFHREDAELGNAIANLLKGEGFEVKPVFVKGFETKVRSRQLEIWMSRHP